MCNKCKVFSEDQAFERIGYRSNVKNNINTLFLEMKAESWRRAANMKQATM